MNQAAIQLDAKKAAYQILDSVWSGRGFPVEPLAIGVDMGLRVLEAELPENMLGGLVKDANKQPVVMLNQIDTPEHKRFNCAQKLGVYMEHCRREPTHFRYVEFRLRTTNDDVLEAFGDAFAAALLMPELAVRQMARKGMAFKAMTQHFGVSREALEFRLRQLGIDLEQIVVA